MGATLRVSLKWQESMGDEEHLLVQEFAGEDRNDLAMLGASQGWLEGLRKAAEPNILLGNMAKIGALVESVLHPPREPVLMPAVDEREGVIQTTEGLLLVKASSKEALDRVRALLETPMAERLQGVIDAARSHLVFMIQTAKKQGLLRPEDVELLFTAPAQTEAAPE